MTDAATEKEIKEFQDKREKALPEITKEWKEFWLTMLDKHGLSLRAILQTTRYGIRPMLSPEPPSDEDLKILKESKGPKVEVAKSVDPKLGTK